MRSLGILLILSASLFVSRVYRRHVVREARALYELKELFVMIDCALSVNPVSITEIISGTQLPRLEELGFIGGVKGGATPAVVYRRVHKSMGLGSEIDAAVLSFFEHGCRGEYSRAVNSAREVKNRLQCEWCAKEKESSARIKTFTVVSLALALGVAIMVI